MSLLWVVGMFPSLIMLIDSWVQKKALILSDANVLTYAAEYKTKYYFLADAAALEAFVDSPEVRLALLFLLESS